MIGLVYRNVEATLGGKSDPYLRVMLNGVVKARTDVVNNSQWSRLTEPGQRLTLHRVA